MTSYLVRTFGAFANRDFRLYWIGQIFSLNGAWMQIVAINWLVYELTDSPLMLAAVNFIALLPAGLASLLGGVIADRFPRQTLLILTQIVLAMQALVITFLSYTGAIRIWHIFAVVLVVGIASAVEDPTRLAFLRDIVGRAHLANAVGLNSFMFNLAGSLGPIIAGILIASYGVTACFLVNFLTYLIIIVIIRLIRPREAKAEVRSLKLGKDLIGGIKYVLDSGIIRGLLLMIAISALLIRPYTIILPVFARDVFGAGARGYGILMGAVGAGAVTGALIVASLSSGRRGIWFLAASFGFPALMILFALTPRLWPATGLLYAASTSGFVQQVLATALVMLAADDEFQGRVASLLGLARNGLTRLGGVQAGFVAQYWSAQAAIIGGALLGGLLLALAFWRLGVVSGIERQTGWSE